MNCPQKRSVHNQKTAYLFILPSMCILTVFVFIPLISAFIISMLNMNLYMNDISFAGFGNYLKMLQDERVWNATKNTMDFSGIDLNYVHAKKHKIMQVPAGVFLYPVCVFHDGDKHPLVYAAQPEFRYAVIPVKKSGDHHAQYYDESYICYGDHCIGHSMEKFWIYLDDYYCRYIGYSIFVV